MRKMIKMTKKQTNYINNRDLLKEVVLSKEKNKMTDELAKMLILLCKRYASKNNWINYTYNEDMQGFAMLMLVRSWSTFDITKSENPFAYFTQCIKNSFIQYLNQEKKQRDVRDEILVQQGFTPSFGYLLSENDDDDEEEENNNIKIEESCIVIDEEQTEEDLEDDNQEFKPIHFITY